MSGTDANRGSQANIAIWICIVASGFAVLSKVVTKLVRGKTHIKLQTLGVDDATVGLSFVFAVVQTTVVSQQISRGWSHYRSTTSASEGSVEEKLYYVSQLFYLLALSAAKFAAFHLAISLRPARHLCIILRGGLLSSILWSIASILAVLFQCRLPDPWRIYSGQCVNQVALWASIEGIGALLDAILGITLCAILLDLQMSQTKYILMAVFAARLVVVVPVGFRLHYIVQEQRDHPSPSVSIRMLVAISTAISMNACIIMTCIPFLKVLMENLQQGWTTSDVRRGVGFTAVYGKPASSSTTFPSGSVLVKPSKASLVIGTSQSKKKAETTGLAFITNAIVDPGMPRLSDD